MPKPTSDQLARSATDVYVSGVRLRAADNGKQEATELRLTFLRDTLITAIEGGVRYWATPLAYDPEIGYAVLRDDEDAERGDLIVSLAVVARGWSRYRGQTINGAEYGREAVRANRTNGDRGDYDADVADNVVQLGLFGEIIYG